MITYDWNCKAVNARPLEGGEVDVVYNVDWIVTGTSDIPAPEGFSPDPSPFYFAVDRGLQDLTWDPESTFIPFEDLTNENELYYPNSKILKHYSKSDIYLNLSRIESFGITFIESLSCNLPIITFDRKGANEIVKNLNNGFVIENKNFSSFIKCLNKFYKNKNFFKNRPYLSSRKYDLDQLIYIYIKTYNNLSNQK